MAYFCSKTGVRLKTPGIAKSAGGDAEELVSEQAEPSPAPPPPQKPEPVKRAKVKE